MADWTRLPRIVQRLSRHYRVGRMKWFCERFSIGPASRVLDVGGTGRIWELSPERPALTIVNLAPVPADGAQLIRADARRLPFRDGAFPVVFSNSVMEHVGGYPEQLGYAAEIRRVGRGYYVQTGNQRFPIELHLLTPFVHWLPKTWQRRLVRNFTVWGLLARPTMEEVDTLLHDLRLPTEREMRACFPDAEIRFERLLGMKKALIAVKVEGS